MVRLVDSSSQRLMTADGSGELPGVGVNQKFLRIRPDALTGIPAAGNSISISLSGTNPVYGRLEDRGIASCQVDAVLAVRPKQAKLDSIRKGRVDSELNALGSTDRAQRIEGLLFSHRCRLLYEVQYQGVQGSRPRLA